MKEGSQRVCVIFVCDFVILKTKEYILHVFSKSNTQWRRSKSIIIERLTAENKIKIEESSPHFLQLSTSVTRCLLPSATASFAAAFQKHHCWPGCIANNREQRNGTEGSHCGGWGDTENKFHLPPLIVCRQHRPPPPLSLSLSMLHAKHPQRCVRTCGCMCALVRGLWRERAKEDGRLVWLARALQ